MNTASGQFPHKVNRTNTCSIYGLIRASSGSDSGHSKDHSTALGNLYHKVSHNSENHHYGEDVPLQKTSNILRPCSFKYYFKRHGPFPFINLDKLKTRLLRPSCLWRAPAGPRSRQHRLKGGDAGPSVRGFCRLPSRGNERPIKIKKRHEKAGEGGAQAEVARRPAGGQPGGSSLGQHRVSPPARVPGGRTKASTLRKVLRQRWSKRPWGTPRPADHTPEHGACPCGTLVLGKAPWGISQQEPPHRTVP